MEINEQKLYEHYKEIQKQCIKDNRLIPDIFPPVPKEYKLSKDEFKGKKGNSEKIQEAYMNRRKEEILILQGKHKHYETIRELQENELENFLKDYPQFKDIIKNG